MWCWIFSHGSAFLSKTKLEMTAKQLLSRMLKFAEALPANCQYRRKSLFLSSKMQEECKLAFLKTMPKHWFGLLCLLFKSIVENKMPLQNDAKLIPQNLTLNSFIRIYLLYLLKGCRSRLWGNWRTWIHIISL